MLMRLILIHNIRLGQNRIFFIFVNHLVTLCYVRDTKIENIKRIC